MVLCDRSRSREARFVCRNRRDCSQASDGLISCDIACVRNTFVAELKAAALV